MRKKMLLLKGMTLGVIYLLCTTHILSAAEDTPVIYPLIYEREKKQYKSKEGIISFKDKLYIEANELMDIIGYTLASKNNTIYISDKEIPLEERQRFAEATIVALDTEQRLLKILPKGYERQNEHIQTIYFNKDTTVTYPLLDRIFPIDILKEGMQITIDCLLQANNKVLAYQASTIEIIDQESLMDDVLPTIQKVYILEINQTKQYIIVTYELTKPEDKAQQMMIHIDYNTNIKDEQGNSHYTLEDLQYGQRVNIITNGIKTQSVPPQTLGLEIILLN